jgi:DNA-binding GntR family transcriptional regulator
MIAESLSHRAYTELLDRLLDGRLQAGSRIDRRAIAAELGVSVSPVVDALGRLANEGMVEILPRRGTRVRPVTAGLFREQVIFRTALETQAARLYCGVPVCENFGRLSSMCADLDQAPCGPELWRAETDFHLALAELCGASALVDALRKILLFSHFAISHLVLPDTSPRREHRSLLEALRTEEPAAAAAAVRAHLTAAREAVLRMGASKADVIL